MRINANRMKLKTWKKCLLVLCLFLSLLSWRYKLHKSLSECCWAEAINEPPSNKEAFCQFPLPPTPRWFGWKKVGNSNKTFMLSAFLDVKHSKYSILIIGMSRRRLEIHHFCRIWSMDIKTQVVKAAVGRSMPDSHPKRYYPWSYSCEVGVDEISEPAFVSIVEYRCQHPSYILVLQNGKQTKNDLIIKTAKNETRVNFTVCLSPIHSRYDSYHQLIEWIEVNRMFGVDRFVVYNYSCGKNVEKVLKYYHEEGLIETVPWILPFNSTKEIHYYGQTIALNDCLHRLRKFSRFIINVDVDEVIVPRNSLSYYEMIQQTFKEGTNDTNETGFDEISEDSIYYSVRNVFFHNDRGLEFFNKNRLELSWKNVSKKIFLFRIRTLWNTHREPFVFAPGSRSKLIVGTKDPPWLNIHDSYFVSPSLVVQEHMGLLHHYRTEQFDNSPLPSLVEDNYMHTFAPLIIARLENVYKKLF